MEIKLSEGDKKDATLSLKIIIGCLVVGVIVLVVVNSVLLFRPKNEPANENEEDIDFAMEYVSEEGKAGVVKHREINAKVNELRNSSSVTPSDITKLYQPVIDEYINSKDIQHVYMYIMEQKDVLVSFDFKQEALDELEKVDFNMFDASDRYRLYSAVIDLASELGKNDVLAKYESLKAGVKDEYERSFAGSEGAAKEYEAKTKDAPVVEKRGVE